MNFFVCPSCRYKKPVSVKFAGKTVACPKCQAKSTVVDPSLTNRERQHGEFKPREYAGATIATGICRVGAIFACFSGSLCLLAIFLNLTSDEFMTVLPLFAIGIVVGYSTAFSLYLTATTIEIFLDIQNNTHANAYYSKQLAKGLAA